MIPKLDFKYSYVYDDIFRKSIELSRFIKKSGSKYPSPMKIIEFMDEIEDVWEKEGNKILDKISRISGLKWKVNEIQCYVVGFCRPMSDPLTIKLCNDITHAIDVLTHELIHYLQSGVDEVKWNKWQKYLSHKYTKESITTREHIFLNAVHMALYLEIFGADRLMRDMWNSNISKEYKRSWEIVEEEGPDEIVRRFRKIAV